MEDCLKWEQKYPLKSWIYGAAIRVFPQWGGPRAPFVLFFGLSHQIQYGPCLANPAAPDDEITDTWVLGLGHSFTRTRMWRVPQIA